MHIAVAGNIGSGKTTLTTLLANHYKWEAHYEDVSTNPYINDFYEDMQRWSFNLQIYFLNHRFSQVQDIHSNKKTAAVVKLLCETDFVAKNPLFIELAHEVAMHVTAMNPENVQELLGQPFIKDQATTVGELVNQYISKLGENIKVGEFYRLVI